MPRTYIGNTNIIFKLAVSLQELATKTLPIQLIVHVMCIIYIRIIVIYCNLVLILQY